ncbi:MAG: hypothetical protein HW418_2342 [Anaerolineales bacterium]|nr:hypothetical protein [Anaerolineales bacterium]
MSVVVTTEKQSPISDNTIPQCQRRLIQDGNIHVIHVQMIHEAARHVQTDLKAKIIIRLALQKDGKIHVGERIGLTAGVRTEQVSQQDRRHLFKDGLQFSHKCGMDDHALDYTMLYASCHSNGGAEKCTRGGRPQKSGIIAARIPRN